MSKEKWFKFPHDFIYDIRVRRFSFSERWALVCLLCLACESETSGIIQGDDQDIAYECGYESDDEYPDWLKYKQKLVEKRFITILADGSISINNWEATYKPPENKPSRNITDWQILRLIVFQRDNYTCVYCGIQAESMHCDHIIPYSRGGSNEIENLATACSFCNMSKGNKTLDEWRKRL